MTKLRLAPDLSLPVDAVTQRLAFVGRPGSGKSYAATKLAELLHDVGAQFVALDPVGIWVVSEVGRYREWKVSRE